jgi:hypothetical protein
VSPRWWSAVALLCAVVAIAAPHESTQLAALVAGCALTLRTLIDAD